MNLSHQQTLLALYAVRDLIARRALTGQPIPRQFHVFLQHLATSARGTQSVDAAEELATEEFIDTTEAAAILNCSTRWVRQILTDLDGINISGRWVFKRQTVVDYADMKGQRNDCHRLPEARGGAVPPRIA